MALNTELLITLQLVKGLGNKTILGVSKNMKATTIMELCNSWKKLKGSRFEKITTDELFEANKVALRIIDTCKLQNIGIISYFEDGFPENLKYCINSEGKLDPPIVLYYRGNIEALKSPGIAVIGTREPTENGVKAGLYFSKEFAKRNFNIVSGLASGCDTTGHKGALEVGGTTTAFLATGLDWESIYPKENQELAKMIVENHGLLLSEYYIGQKTGRYAFVARDRLQAGLSHATLVIQTGLKGGTMHAVNATLSSNKPLLSVKYKYNEDLMSDKVQGNEKLIHEGKAIALGNNNFEEVVSYINGEIRKKQNKVNNLLFNLKDLI